MHEQFAVAPGFGANDDRVPEADTTRVLGNNSSAARGLSEIAVFGQRDPVDDQHANALAILNASQARISDVLRTQGSAVGENKLLLRFRPLIGERQKLFEFRLIDHGWEGCLGGASRKE